MNINLAVVVTALWTLMPAWLAAQEQGSPVVVELFTSQGCSSCPPADRLMHDLAEREDVIALALHVDYWDYIGWKDQYADPGNTRRQKAYARLAGRNMIYTPQMIINGQDELVGARSMKLAELIERHKDHASPVSVQAHRTGEELMVEASAPVEICAPCDIHLVRFDPERTIEITRGENAGRTLTYVNVVADWQVIGSWHGAEPLKLESTVTGDLPAAVLFQLPGPGPIVAAARVQ